MKREINGREGDKLGCVFLYSYFYSIKNITAGIYISGGKKIQKQLCLFYLFLSCDHLCSLTGSCIRKATSAIPFLTTEF